MTKGIWYTMQHAHSAEMADDMHVRDTLRGDGLWEESGAYCVQFPPGSACLRLGPDSPDPGPGVMTMRRTLKRDIPQLLTQRRKKINGLCIASEQWKAFSHQKILPLSHLSPFSSTPRPNNRPCVVTPGLELHSPCVRLWTIHKTKRPCDPSHSSHTSHTLAPQIYWIVFSPVIDTPPDAADEDAPLTWLHFVFDNSSPIIIEKLNFDDVNW